MARSAATLRAHGISMHEVSQTAQSTASIGQTLSDLIAERNLIVYPNDDLRSAVLNAVAVESVRGVQLKKATASRKIRTHGGTARAED